MNKIIRKSIKRSLIVAAVLTVVYIFLQIIYYNYNYGVGPIFSILDNTTQTGCHPVDSSNVAVPDDGSLLGGVPMLCVDGPTSNITLVGVVSSYLVFFVIVSAIYCLILMTKGEHSNRVDKSK